MYKDVFSGFMVAKPDRHALDWFTVWNQCGTWSQPQMDSCFKASDSICFDLFKFIWVAALFVKKIKKS